MTNGGFKLPTLLFNKSTRTNKKYREAVMDAFEGIGLEQVRFNIREYDDIYKMCDGTLSSKEFKLMAPQYSVIGDLLDKAELPSSVTHWDILGGVINILVGKLVQMTDKFDVTDTGEIAQNEFLRNKSEQIRSSLKKFLEAKIRMAYVQNGINPEDGSKIEDEQQKQAFMQQLQAIQDSVVSESEKKLADNANFKTLGVKWAQAVIKEDRELLDFDKQHKKLFAEYLKTGSCAKITKIIYDSYKSFVWDSRTLFHSKDIGKEMLNEFAYAGRVHAQTPMQVIEEWGQYISFKDQNRLVEGDEMWKSAKDLRYAEGNYKDMIKHNFNKLVTEDYLGQTNELFHRKLEDMSGIPMAEYVFFDKEGNESRQRNWIPRGSVSSAHKWFARYLETRFPIDSNICQVTEVYYRAMEAVGYISYTDNDGNPHYGERVTEDIYSDFLKENGIKQIKNKGYVDMVDDFELDTIVWQLRPVIGWGVKIVPSTSMQPIYLGVEPMEIQIKGDNEFDFKLPVTGLVGKSLSKKIEPWQALYNYSWNSVRSLIEKQLGMFFVLGVDNIPSEFAEAGDTKDALISLRNLAKNTGFMPVAMTSDGLNAGGIFNQMSVHNLSHGEEINTNMAIAQRAKTEMYMAIGLNPNEGMTPTSGVTEEGIKQSNEAMQTQIQTIYDDFNNFLKVDYNQHLSIAQFVRTNNKDNRIFYTNDDASITFLQLYDPDLPLRKLGIVVTDDSRRKMELASIKQAILQRSTSDMDSKELVGIVTTKGWRELLEIAEEERELKKEMAELNHQRQMELMKQQSELLKQQKDDDFERKEYSNQLDRRTRIEVASIQATGRAADRQGSDVNDYKMIQEARKASLQENRMSQDFEAKEKELEQRQEELKERKRKALADDEFKARSLDLKEKEIEAKIYTSEINKN